MLLVGRQEGHPACKNIGGDWALVSLDGVVSSRMVGVSASVNLPLHHKVQKFSSGTGSPGWFQKRGRKMVVCYYVALQHELHLTCCYRRSSTVCQSVSLSVMTTSSGKNGWTDQDAVWDVDLGGLKEVCIRWRPDPPTGRDTFEGMTSGFPTHAKHHSQWLWHKDFPAYIPAFQTAIHRSSRASH